MNRCKSLKRHRTARPIFTGFGRRSVYENFQHVRWLTASSRATSLTDTSRSSVAVTTVSVCVFIFAPLKKRLPGRTRGLYPCGARQRFKRKKVDARTETPDNAGKTRAREFPAAH
jgi:hypothetical protein